ncbi:MAG: ABC transporter permease [Chloroflexi bacterium]|nr:MAG: ABC transporter permease [Chloroflexota bacterium]
MVVGQEVVRFLAQRIALGALVVVFASALTFFFVNLAPGGPASVMRFDVSAEQREALIHRMGLDRPVPERYVEWLAAAVRGDLGSSLLTDEPVAQRIGERLPNTLALAGSALLLSVGVVLILVFAVSLHVLPSAGVTGVASDSLGDRLAHLVLPAVALATTILPTIVRFVRSSTIEVLDEDYIRTATSKGLSPRTVITRHALRNALIPVVSAIGALVPRLLGGTVVTEAVFGWPGMGRLALEAAQGRDYPLVTGLTVVVAAIAVVASLAVDLAYTRIDPRIRLT